MGRQRQIPPDYGLTDLDAELEEEVGDGLRGGGAVGGRTRRLQIPQAVKNDRDTRSRDANIK